MATQAPGFNDLWNRLPWVTKHISVGVIVLHLICVLYPYFPLQVWNIPGAPKWQVYRFVTSAMCTSGNGIGAVLSIFMFCTNLNDLESNFMRSRSRPLYYLAFITLVYHILGPRFHIYCYLDGIISALTWTLSQEEPFGMINVVVIPVQRRYAPLVQLGIAFLAGNGLRGLIDPLLGFFAAHMFMYLTEIVPDCGGPQWLRQTPYLFTYPDRLEAEQQKAREYGSGYKLGKEKKNR